MIIGKKNKVWIPACLARNATALQAGAGMTREWWGRLALSASPFLIIFFPFLIGKWIFSASDLFNWLYPVYNFYKNSLLTGESIFWNPNNFSGFPSFLGSMGFLSPLNYLFFRFLPVFTAYNSIIFLNATLSLFFTWELLKKFKLSLVASFVGGLVYVFSQWDWVTDIAVSNALPVLPLLFLILFKSKEEKKSIWLIILGSFLIAYSWVSIHFNWLVMILTAGFLFSLFLVWFCKKKIIVLKFFLMVLIGTGFIFFVLIAPLSDYSTLSARSLGLSYSEGIDNALSIGDFVRFFLPYFKISTFKIASSPAQLYVGILPLFFLIFALKKKSSFVLFFSSLFFLGLLISIKHSPLFWILHKLPVYSSFRGSHRWMFVASFAGAILASFGLEWFLTQKKENKTFLLLKIFKWVNLGFLSLCSFSALFFYFFRNKFILLSQEYFDKYIYHRTSGLELSHYHKFIEDNIFSLEKNLSILNFKVFLPILFMFLSYFLVKKKSQKYFSTLVILIIILNFFGVFAFYHSAISRDTFSYQPKTVEFIKEKMGKYNNLEARKIFSFLPGFSEYIKLTVPYGDGNKDSFIFQSEMLPPNLNLLYNLQSADYYDNLMSRRMSRIIALLGSDRATFGKKLSDLSVPVEEKAKKFQGQKKLLELIGVRYVISAFPLNNFEKVFETEILAYNISIEVYENKDARPLFYFADGVEVIEIGEEEAYQKLLESPLKSKSIFIECVSCDDLDINGRGEIILEKKSNNRIQLKTKSESNQLLVFSQNHLPGWRAYLDDKEIPIYTAGSVYMSVFIPEGEHRVLFKYDIF